MFNVLKSTRCNGKKKSFFIILHKTVLNSQKYFSQLIHYIFGLIFLIIIINNYKHTNVKKISISKTFPNYIKLLTNLCQNL